MVEFLLLSRDELGRYLLVLSLFVLLGMVWFLFSAIPKIVRIFPKVPLRVVACLISILLVSSYVKIFVYPHYFGMYMDDYYPLEVANKVAMGNFNGLDPIFVSNGVLFLPAFFLFGAGYAPGMYTMIFISMISLVLLFFLCYLLTRDWSASLIATAFMSLYASHVHYAISAYNHTPVFFFTMLALVFFFLYFEAKDVTTMYAAIFSLIYLILMRMEMLLLPLFLFAFYLFRRRPKIKECGAWAPWLLFGLGIMMLIPRFLFYAYDLRNHPEIGMSNMFFLKNISEILKILDMGYLLAVLAFMGIVLCFYRKSGPMLLVVLMVLPLLLLHLFMSFEQIQGARHLHFPMSVIFLLAAMGISFGIHLLKEQRYRSIALIALLFGILLLGAARHVSAAKTMKEDPLFNRIYFDTRLAGHAASLIPNGCIIVSPHPTKYLATTKAKAIAVEEFMAIYGSALREGCYVFADDLSCSYPQENVKGKCDRIREAFDLEYLGSIDSAQILTPNKSIRINATYFYIRHKSP